MPARARLASGYQVLNGFCKIALLSPTDERKSHLSSAALTTQRSLKYIIDLHTVSLQINTGNNTSIQFYSGITNRNTHARPIQRS